MSITCVRQETDGSLSNCRHIEELNALQERVSRVEKHDIEQE